MCYIFFRIYACVTCHIFIFTNPSARAGYDTRSIFKRGLTGLNSEFSFSLTSLLTKAEEPSLPYYLLIAGRKIIGFIPFPRVLVLCEMQSVSWNRVAVSISYDDNHYTTVTCHVLNFLNMWQFIGYFWWDFGSQIWAILTVKHVIRQIFNFQSICPRNCYFRPPPHCALLMKPKCIPVQIILIAYASESRFLLSLYVRWFQLKRKQKAPKNLGSPHTVIYGWNPKCIPILLILNVYVSELKFLLSLYPRGYPLKKQQLGVCIFEWPQLSTKTLRFLNSHEVLFYHSSYDWHKC